MPTNLNSTNFTNSGAEAVEGALKLARKYTQRFEIIACRNAYHGSTAGAESLRSDLEYVMYSRPLVPGIKHIEFNRLDDLAKITGNTAAVIVEPIQGEAGVIVPQQNYLKELQRRCNEKDALLIVDEIQTGMGRTGSMWRFEKEGIQPDVLLVAKAFGSGLPLGAFISSKEIMRSLSVDPPLGHLTTFGGNALCCVAAHAALNVIVEENLHLKAVEKGNKIKTALASHPSVNEIRGEGLMLAIELNDPAKLAEAIKSCRNEGLLVDFFLFNDSRSYVLP